MEWLICRINSNNNKEIYKFKQISNKFNRFKKLMIRIISFRINLMIKNRIIKFYIIKINIIKFNIIKNNIIKIIIILRFMKKKIVLIKQIYYKISRKIMFLIYENNRFKIKGTIATVINILLKMFIIKANNNLLKQIF